MSDSSTANQPTTGRPVYGTRDDMPTFMRLLCPGTQYTVMVRGRLRDVIQVVNKTEWKIIEAEAYVDEFLENYHSCKESVNDG